MRGRNSLGELLKYIFKTHFRNRLSHPLPTRRRNPSAHTILPRHLHRQGRAQPQPRRSRHARCSDYASQRNDNHGDDNDQKIFRWPPLGDSNPGTRGGCSLTRQSHQRRAWAPAQRERRGTGRRLVPYRRQQRARALPRRRWSLLRLQKPSLSQLYHTLTGEDHRASRRSGCPPPSSPNDGGGWGRRQEVNAASTSSASVCGRGTRTRDRQR